MSKEGQPNSEIAVDKNAGNAGVIPAEERAVAEQPKKQRLA